MKKDFKLLHLANHIHHNLFTDLRVIGGFYNWHRVFYYPNNFVCWDIHTPKKIREEKPDAILLGLSRPESLSMLPEDINRAISSGNNDVVVDPIQIGRRKWMGKHVGHMASDSRMQELPQRINEFKHLEDIMETRPLKIFHIDYAVQMWKDVDAFRPGLLRYVLEQADFLFTAEPAQGHAMYALLGGKKDIYFIPHPTNVHAFKEVGIEGNKTKSPIIRSIIHRYDNEWYLPMTVSFSLREIEKSYQMMFTLLDGNKDFGTHIKSMGIDHYEYGKPHSQWLQTLQETFACLDSYHWFRNYGRTVVECACLKTPLVGTTGTYLQPILYPEITSEPGAVDDQVEMLLKLMNDDKFYKECQDYAYTKVEDYNYDNSRDRFLDMIEGRMEPRWKAGRFQKYST